VKTRELFYIIFLTISVIEEPFGFEAWSHKLHICGGGKGRTLDYLVTEA